MVPLPIPLRRDSSDKDTPRSSRSRRSLGPVDFKASSGASVKVLIELKKEHNGKFWNGLEKQLPSYLMSDECDEGWYVVLRFRSNKPSDERLRHLPIVVDTVARDTGKTLHYATVDARPKASASNLEADGA